MHRAEQFDRIEVDALQAFAGSGLGEDGWHDDWIQHLDDELVEDLRDGDGAAVEAGRREIQHACKKELRCEIVEHVDDDDAARIGAEADHFRICHKRRAEEPGSLRKVTNKTVVATFAGQRTPDRCHEAVVQDGERDRQRCGYEISAEVADCRVCQSPGRGEAAPKGSPQKATRAKFNTETAMPSLKPSWAKMAAIASRRTNRIAPITIENGRTSR